MLYNSYRSPDGNKEKNAGVSALGYGAMRFPTDSDGKIDRPAAEALLTRAYTAGVNYFDTAYPYHGGNSEEFLCSVLSSVPRDTYYLADKMPGWLVRSPEDAPRIFAEQLVRTKAGYFDFYLCHALSSSAFEKVRERGVLDFLEKMRSEGVIRRLGFSFHDTPAALDVITDTFNWDFAQIQFNYLDYTMQDARGQLEILQRKHIPAVVMEPVRGGALAKLPEKAMRMLLDAYPDATAASHALRFAMSQPGVFCTLSGMSDATALEDNLASADCFCPVEAKERDLLFRCARVIVEARLIPCTACRYCVDACPHGIAVPELLQYYNAYTQDERRAELKLAVAGLTESSRPAECASCGACAAVCPQKIEIPGLIGKINGLISR